MGGFFPGKKYGGPPVSIDNFCTLMKEHECYIVTHDHDLFDNKRYTQIKKGWNDRGNCKVLYLSDYRYKKIIFEKVIKELKPDFLYLQGLFQQCVFPCLQLAQKYKIKVLLAPRGELCSGAFNMKKYKKLPYVGLLRIMRLIKNVHFQSTSDEETYAITKLLGCPTSHIHRLDNIPSIPKKEYKRGEKVSGKGRFVFLARIHPKKNLLNAIKYFNHVNGDVIFDIYGSVEDDTYWKECQDAIKALPQNIKCEYKGLVPHDQVHEVFSQYDAFLFPTLSENYGHVIAESLTVGTQVIISDQTPWTDLDIHNAGFVCKLNDKNSFEKSITHVINDSENHSEIVKSYIMKKIKIENIKKEYENVFFKQL